MNISGSSSSKNSRKQKQTGAKSLRKQSRTTYRVSYSNTRTRSNYSGAYRRGSTKRKQQPDYMKVAIIGVLLIIVILCAVLFTKGCSDMSLTGVKETEASTMVKETELEKEVTVDGIIITGMSRQQAKETLLKEFPWAMKVTYQEQSYNVTNLMGEKIDILLEEIYTGTPKESYSIDTSGLDDAAKAEAAAVGKLWDVSAKNGSVSSFNKETGNFEYAGEQSGLLVDQNQVAEGIKSALKQKQFDAVIEAKVDVIEPDITEAKAKEMYKVIGTYTTTTTNNSNRNTNIKLASDAINGLIIQPGQEFSFNNTTGNRTEERGYKPAGAYSNGVLVEEPGGGVCQVSSTLYNAVIFSGLTTTERHAHTFEPSYVTPGEDAMVSYDGYAGPDMKFVNNSSTAVAIRTNFIVSDRKLTISIIGIPILEDGVTLSMKSEKVAELDGPVPIYVEDPALEPGIEVIVKAGTLGSRWKTNMITKKNGEVINDEFFHTSTYKGHQATVSRNTSGVVIPPVESTEAGLETESSKEATENTTGAPLQEGPAYESSPASLTAAEPGNVEPQKAATDSEINLVQPKPSADTVQAPGQ